ncbi:Y-family DNA polymerase [Duganella levis]|uniref:DNA polymerase Y family protein n=1 Tax=Duganella levis TaxID=2692169 RepID=A0ABW9VZ81_9BURK|nr:DNA polymerase Y family protein [Duganella levis]MYN26961.1 DNA polymerase Y family protein [Duganella levis]
MKLLLSVHLPLLPLEALRPRWSEPGSFAVVDQGDVISMSPSAAMEGVKVGMRSAGVAAVSPNTIVLERAQEREEVALDALATALMQFTPEVTFQPDFSVLLDVSASLTLFRGPHALCARVTASVEAMGLSAQLGVAPTAEAAWLLAQSYRMKGMILRRRVLSIASLHRRLDMLPCSLVPAAALFHDWLNDVGAKRLSALRRLPRAGLLRRTSKELLAALDRAYGEAPELHEWIQPPLTFSARLETFDRIEHADALLYGATSLILQLVGWLVALQQSVRTFVILMEHERGRAAVAPTPLEIALAEPAWHEHHLIRLLKERLAKVELERPVIALRLEVLHVEPMLPPNESLFPEPGGSPQDYTRLLELLTARLGAEHVLVPACVDDHRPEIYNCWVPATTKQPKSQIEGILGGRPFWLLPNPIKLLVRGERPVYISQLQILEGPERLEAGWWSDQIEARDYYVAQSTDASCYWIYRERIQGDVLWYLHGLFA